MSKAIDYSGRKFAHLTMHIYLRPGGSGRGAVWLAQCDCGKMIETLAREVARGKRRSCGKCQYSRKLRSLARGLKLTPERRAYGRQAQVAIARGEKWDISPGDFAAVRSDKCCVCHIPDPGPGRQVVLLDSMGSWSKENLVLLCRECNRMRGPRTLKEFLEILIQISTTGYLSSH